MATERERQARVTAAVNAFWVEATKNRPPHDHRKGDANCPRCSTREAFLAEQTPIIQQIVAEYRATGHAPPPPPVSIPPPFLPDVPEGEDKTRWWWNK